MARDHARMKTSMWRDSDWLSLTVAQQHAYQMLATSPDLSYCGVMIYAPALLADNAADLTEGKVKRAVASLVPGRWVLIDTRSHELLVRSYVRHDGVLDRPNMGRATASALARVMSAPLRDAVIDELARLWRQSPGLSGWAGFKDASPDAFADVMSRQEDQQCSMQ